MNSVTLTGRLTAAPDLKIGQSGKTFARAAIAVASGTKDRKETSFFNLVAFGDLADGIATLNKGDRIIATGRIKQDDWTDDEGRKRPRVTMLLDDLGASAMWQTVTVDRTASNQTRPAPDPAEGWSDEPF